MNVKDISPKSAANVTPEVLAAWQKEYPTGVFEIAINSDDFTLVDQETGPPKKEFAIKYRGWVRKPTRNEMRELSAKRVDPITYGEIALEMLWLGGDIELKTDDETFYSVNQILQSVLDIKQAELKKL